MTTFLPRDRFRRPPDEKAVSLRLEEMGFELQRMERDINARITSLMPKNTRSRGLLQEGHLHGLMGGGGVYADYIIDGSYTGPPGAIFRTGTGFEGRVFARLDGTSGAVAHANSNRSSTGQDTIFFIAPGDYTVTSTISPTPPAIGTGNETFYHFVGSGRYRTTLTSSGIVAGGGTKLFDGGSASDRCVTWSGMTLVTAEAINLITAPGAAASYITDVAFIPNVSTATGIDPNGPGGAQRGCWVRGCSFVGSGTGINSPSAIAGLYVDQSRFINLLRGIFLTTGSDAQVHVDQCYFDTQADIAFGGAATHQLVTITGNDLSFGIVFTGSVTCRNIVINDNAFNLGASDIGIDWSAMTNASVQTGINVVGNTFKGVAGAQGIKGKGSPNGGPRTSIVKANTFIGFTSGQEIQNMTDSTQNAGNKVDNNVSDAGTLPTMGSGLTVQEDNADVNTDVRTIDFTEPDGVAVATDGTNPQEVDVNLGLYALLSGRSGGQTILGASAGNHNPLRLWGSSTASPTGSDYVEIRGNSNNGWALVVDDPSSSHFVMQLSGSSTFSSSSTVFQMAPQPTLGANGLTTTLLSVSPNVSVNSKTGAVIYGLYFFGQAVGPGTVSELTSIYSSVNTADAAATFNLMQGIYITKSFEIGNEPTVGSGNVKGMAIDDMGHANFTTVTALDILSQTAGGTSTYNIRQRGTTGVNRFGAPTLIGQDASPTFAIFEVSGGSVSPSAGSLGRIVKITGTLVEAGSGTHARMMGLELIAPTLTAGVAAVTAAATLYIDAAISGTITASQTYSIWADAGNVRIDDQLVVGQATPNSNTRITGATWVNLGAGSSTGILWNMGGTQSANATTRFGFAFAGTYSLNNKTLTDFRGISSAPQLSGSGTSDALTNYVPLYIKSNATGMLSITNSDNIFIDAPDANHGLNSLAVAATTLHTGIRIANQSGSAGMVTGVGIDIEAQSGATTTTIGLRIALATTYALQLSDTSGTAAGGMTLGTDTNLYRVSANRLKTDDDLMVVGNVGFNNATPAAPPTYSESNVTTDRTYDANATSIDELADVVGSMIADLRAIGLFA